MRSKVFFITVLFLFIATPSLALNEDYLGEVSRDGRSGWDLDYGSETEADQGAGDEGASEADKPTAHDGNDFFSGDYDPLDKGTSGVVKEENNAKEQDLKPGRRQDPERDVKSLMQQR